MPVIIYNARVQGYESLVKLVCDSKSHRITSVGSQAKEYFRGPLALSISRPKGFGSVIRLYRLNDWFVVVDAARSLVLPGLVHAHLHLWTPYTETLLIHNGGELTEDVHDAPSSWVLPGLDLHSLLSEQGNRSRMTFRDLLLRGRSVIETSVSHGVTTIRAQVDIGVMMGLQSLEAGLVLRSEFEDRCDVRIAAFAPESIFSGNDAYIARMRGLLRRAAVRVGVRAVASSPFVEDNHRNAMRNINFVLNLAEKYRVDAEFHLGFDITHGERLFDIIEEIRKRPVFQTNFDFLHLQQSGFPLRVTLAHHGSLHSLPSFDRNQLAEVLVGWEVYFVGLPFEDRSAGGTGRGRYTGDMNPRSLHSGDMTPTSLGSTQSGEALDELERHMSLGVENAGNLLAPWDLDPLALLALTVAARHEASESEAQSLLRMVTVNAAAAAGMGNLAHPQSLHLNVGDIANLVILDGCFDCTTAVASPPFGRVTIKRGRVVGGKQPRPWIGP